MSKTEAKSAGVSVSLRDKLTVGASKTLNLRVDAVAEHTGE